MNVLMPISCCQSVHLRRVLAVRLLLLLTACGTLSRFRLDTNDDNARRYAQSGDLQFEVDSLVVPLIRNQVTPGMVVGVLLPDGRQQFFSYGVRDKESQLPPDANTLFAVGSLSKSFLGVMTSMLVQEGKLSWSDTLGQLLPPEYPLSDDAKKITIEQLATHTSGLPRQPVDLQTFRYFVQYLFTGKSFYQHFDLPYTMDYLRTFKAPSGITRQYSNIGYALLGTIVEQRSGMKLEDLLEEKITTPLALQATSYDPNVLPGYAIRAHGYAGDQPKFIRRGEPVPDWEFTPLMKGSASLYSNAHDLLTFASAHFQTDDHALDRALRDTLRVRYAQPGEAAAVAWNVDDHDGHHLAYQVGYVAGYSSYIGLDTEHHIAVVVLQNAFNWTSVGQCLLLRLAHAENYQRATHE